MKKIFLFLLLIFSLSLIAQNKRALILIDIQNFYYPGGASALYNPEIAGKNAQLVLEHFRENNELVLVGMQTHMCLEAATRAASSINIKKLCKSNSHS